MALFPVEITTPVKFWASYYYHDIAQWNHYPRGGHFAAMEQPLMLANDIRMFRSKLEQRKNGGIASNDIPAEDF